MALKQEPVDACTAGQRVGPKGKWLSSRQLQYKAAYSLLRGMMPAWHDAPAGLS